MAALAPLRVKGPPPVALPFGLVTTPGTIIDPGDDHWAGGVAVDSYPTEVPLTHDPCSTGSSRVKEEGTDPPAPVFNSFTVYAPVTCSGIGVGNTAGAELLRSRVKEVFAATESYGVERELMWGDSASTASPATPFLADTFADILNGTGVGPREALSLLEQEIGKTARQGFVHVDPATFVAMDAWGLFHDVGATKMTNRGNVVIVGNGYISLTAADVPADDQGALTADQGWAFATGPVQIARDDIFVPDFPSSIDHRTNDVTFRAERNYVVFWDTALQAAVLVDRSTTP